MKKIFSTCVMAMAAVATSFAAESPFSVFPDPSEPLTGTLQEIVVSMADESETITSLNNNDGIFVTLDGMEYRTTNCNVTDGELFVFVLGGGMDVPGNYSLVISAGSISINNVATTEDYLINYTYGGGNFPSNPYLNPTYPEAGTVISQIDSFWIENKTGNNLVLENAEGIYVAIDFEKVYDVELNVMDYGFEAYIIGDDGYITDITEHGEYQLIIEPRSLALVNPDDENDITYIDEPIYFTYIVGTPDVDLSNYPIDFYPSPNSTVAALEYISIEPNQEMGYIGIDVIEDPAYQVGICDESQENFYGFSVEYEEGFIRLVLDEPITAPGNYTLMILPYTFVAFNDVDGFYNEEMLTIPYTVVGPIANPYDAPFRIIEPEASVIDAVYYVELDIDQESGYTEFIVNDPEGFYFTKDGAFYCDGSVDLTGDVIYVDANPYITAPGEYTFVIEKGAMGWKNETETVNNPEQYVFNFTIPGNGESIPFTISPEDGETVSSLSTFTITFDPEYYDSYIEPYQTYFINTADYDNAAVVSIEQDPENESVYILTLVDEDGNPVTITEAGTYQLAFDQFAIAAESAEKDYYNSTLLTFTYVVDGSTSGIEAVTTTVVPEGVYNLMGVKVGETTENLPAGIYIVNGKKVVVK